LQDEVVTGEHRPAPSQAAAAVEMPALQLAGRQVVEGPGYVQALVRVPSQVPLQVVPDPVQAGRPPTGLPLTGEQAPTWPVRLQAWSFKEQIFTEVAASSLDPGKPEDQKIIEQALAVAESCRFIWIDATDSAVPRTTRVTVIERVEDVAFTVTMKVQERKSDSALDIYLDRIKSDYEAASKKTEGK
jgi:hypothetical protein